MSHAPNILALAAGNFFITIRLTKHLTQLNHVHVFRAAQKAGVAIVV